VISIAGIAWGLGAMLTWGVADYLARVNAERIGSRSTSLLVQTVGLILPTIYLAATLPGVKQDIDWHTIAYLAPIIALLMAAAYVVYYKGLQCGSVSIVSALASAWLGVAVIVAAVLLKEPISSQEFWLIGLVLTGIAFLSLQPKSISGNHTGFTYGVLSMLTMGAAFALWKPLTEAGSPALSVVIVRLMSSGATFAFMKMSRDQIILPAAKIPWLLMIITATLDAMGYIAYNIGIEVAPFTLIAPICAAHPIATGALAWWLLRERPTRIQWTGIVVTITGVIILSIVAGT
jgi:drug/metabolite transporter (DMT)-like permease